MKKSAERKPKLPKRKNNKKFRKGVDKIPFLIYNNYRKKGERKCFG